MPRCNNEWYPLGCNLRQDERVKLNELLLAGWTCVVSKKGNHFTWLDDRLQHNRMWVAPYARSIAHAYEGLTSERNRR